MAIRLLLQSFCVRLCYAKYGEISLLLCLFSKEQPGKWKTQAHNERFVKTRLEAASSVSYCKFLADIQLLLLFFSQAHLSVWCHQLQRGREPEQIGLTVSYSLPASQHMLLLYKGCLETKRALQIHRLYPLLKATTEKCLCKRVCVRVCEIFYNFSFGQFICFVVSQFRKSEVGNSSKLPANSVAHTATVVTVSNLNALCFPQTF